MKKQIILVLIATMMLSCSSDDNSSDSKSNQFNPPNWIQGKWTQIGDSGFKFTNDNVCQVISSSNELCFREVLEIYKNSPNFKTDINEEIISSTEYKFSYSISSVTQYFYFKKISDTKIEWVSSPQSITLSKN